MTRSRTETRLEHRDGVAHRDVLWAAFGIPFRTRTSCAEAATALEYQYRELRASSEFSAAPIDVLLQRVAGKGGVPGYRIEIEGEPVASVAGVGHLLHELDNQLAYRLQCRGASLYFVHGAVFARESSATLIAGASGAGKSTTAVALATAGLRYLSDELAGVRLDTGEIHPYARAICLKEDPPPPLRLPATALRTEWTIHVQASELGAPVEPSLARLERFVFLTGAPAHRGGSPLRPLSRGEAAMRLYQNALNQLAHPGSGLDDTIRLVAQVDCFELGRAPPEEMLEAFAEIGAF